MTKFKASLLLSLVLLISLVACGPDLVDPGASQPSVTPPPEKTVTISGQVMLEDNADEPMLPSGSQVIVQVQDTSRADAPAEILGEQLISGSTSFPIDYGISVDLSELEDAMQASISVRIEDAEGRLLYINDTVHPVSIDEIAVDVRVITVAGDESEAALPPAFEGQVWQWLAFQVSASDDESNDITVDDPAKYTIELLADGTYVLQADCNVGGGRYMLDGNNLTLEPGPITLAACGPDSLSERFVSLLADVETLAFNAEGNLVLNLTADTGSMRFAPTPVSESTLDGTSWVLSSILVADAVINSEVDAEITVEFLNGELTGVAGCNSYFAGYEIDGTTLTLGEMGKTAMSCDETRNQREEEFLAALQSVTGYRLYEDLLALLDAEGNVLIEMQAAETAGEAALSDQLLGVWQWQTLEVSASGAESNDISVDDPKKYTLELLTGGAYTIQADCNVGGGQYTVDGSSLALEAGPITLTECGPESLSNLFVAHLNDVVTFAFDRENNLLLSLRTDAGNMIFARPQ